MTYTMTGETRRLQLADLRRRPVRQDHGSEAELKALAQSWLDNPIHPILVRLSDLTIADGHRRVAGLELLGKAEADCFCMDGDIPDEKLAQMAFVSAFHRAALGGYEQATALLRMKATGATNKSIAEMVNVHPGTVTQHLSLGDCVEEVKEAAKAGKINATDWYAISQAPRERQREFLDMRRKGLSSKALAEAVRVANAGPAQPAAPEPERLDSAKLCLPSGLLIAKKSEMDIAGLITLLKEALSHVEAAKVQNYTLKTLSKMLADRAKGGFKSPAKKGRKRKEAAPAEA